MRETWVSPARFSDILQIHWICLCRNHNTRKWVKLRWVPKKEDRKIWHMIEQGTSKYTLFEGIVLQRSKSTVSCSIELVIYLVKNWAVTRHIFRVNIKHSLRSVKQPSNWSDNFTEGKLQFIWWLHKILVAYFMLAPHFMQWKAFSDV